MSIQKAGRGLGILVACKMAKPGDIGIIGAQSMRKIESFALKNGIQDAEKEVIYQGFTNSANRAMTGVVNVLKRNPEACKTLSGLAYQDMRRGLD